MFDYHFSLLGEYHELYELQRRRLEKQVFHLTSERDLWSSAAYSLALKVRGTAHLVDPIKTVDI